MLLFAIALIGFTTTSKAQGVFLLTKKNGSAQGFDHVQKITDSLGNTRMTCTGAGNTKAEFVKPPDDKSQTDINTIIRFVDKQVKAGKLSGVTVIDGMLTKWEGSDVYNYSLRIAPENKQ